MALTLTWAPASKISMSSRLLRTCVLLAGTVLMATMMGLAQGNVNRTATSRPIESGTSLPTTGTGLPDANEQMQMREAKARKANFDAANAERLKQLSKASHMLETLAIALKAEIEKDPSGAVSENEVQKAENIEKLARMVKEQMKLTVGPN
jgi:hypothetical protein